MKATNDKHEQAWIDHCSAMASAYETKATELKAAGWCKHGKGRTEYFTNRNAQPIVIRRELGSPTWYTAPKDF